MSFHDEKPATPMSRVIELGNAHSASESANVANAMSAVYTLPPEVLGLIFEECAECVRDSEASDKWTWKLALGHITSHLRVVALDTPSLWCQISHSMMKTDLAMTAAFLQRSKASLLHIDLRIDSDSQPILSSVLAVLIPHVHRLRKFFVTGTVHFGLKSCIDQLAGLEAPSLTSLNIRQDYGVRYGDEINAPALMTIFGSGMPRLTFIQLDDIAPYCFLPLPPSAKCLRINGTTHAYYDCDFYSLSALIGLQNLTHLNIDDSTIYDWRSPQPIHFHALIKLSVHAHSDKIIPGLLSVITAPMLQSLVLGGVRPWDLDAIFAKSSLSHLYDFPNLQCLAMDITRAYCDFTAENWDQLTVCFPRITDFTIRDSTHDIEAMSSICQSALLGWPGLRTFTLNGRGASEYEPAHLFSLLLEFLGKRNEEGTPIKELRICQTMVDYIKDVGRLASLDTLVEHYHTSGFGLYIEDDSRMTDDLWLSPAYAPSQP